MFLKGLVFGAFARQHQYCLFFMNWTKCLPSLNGWVEWIRYFVNWHSLVPRLRPAFRCLQYGPTHLSVAWSMAPPSFPFLSACRESLGTRLTQTGAIYHPGLYTHGGSLIPSPHRKPSHLSWVWGQLDSINISHSEIIVARCFIITCKHVKVWIKPHFKVTSSAPPCEVG